MGARMKPKNRVTLAALLLVTLAGFTAVTGAMKPGKWLMEKSRDAGLVLERVDVSGISRTAESDVLATFDFDMGVPLLSIDLVALQASLEALPWVKTVEVERQLPGVLAVDVVERKPYALWQLAGQVHLIDASGERVPGQKLAEFANLPLFVGDEANLMAAGLLDALDGFPALKSRLKTAVRVGGRRWDMIFEGGVRVKFPENESPRAMRETLATFMALEREHRLLERDVTVIDLRVPGRLVMRVNPEARHLVNADFKTT